MRKYEYSDEIANVVKKFLADDDWHYSFNEDTGIFRFGLRIRSKIQRINYVIDVHDDEFVTYGMCPIGVDYEDTEMMAQMAEFICRANYGLKNGCFELDFRDGEIRFRSYVDCENLHPSTEVVKNSVHCTAAMIKRYAVGIVDIIFNGTSAKDAIVKCEKKTEDELRLALKGAMGEEASGESVRELLTRIASELEISEENGDGLEDEDRPRHIRLNPFVIDGGSGSDQHHIKMDIFDEEGGEV